MSPKNNGVNTGVKKKYIYCDPKNNTKKKEQRRMEANTPLLSGKKEKKLFTRSLIKVVNQKVSEKVK